MIVKINVDKEHISERLHEWPYPGASVVEAALMDKGIPGPCVTRNGYFCSLTSEPQFLPPAAIDFIRRFDAGEPCEPLAFEVTI